MYSTWFPITRQKSEKYKFKKNFHSPFRDFLPYAEMERLYKMYVKGYYWPLIFQNFYPVHGKMLCTKYAYVNLRARSSATA